MSDEQINLYHEMRPCDFPILEKLELEQVVNTAATFGELVLKLSLRTQDERDDRKLQLSFSGVRRIRLLPEIQPIRLCLVEIVSIEDHQYEDIKYSVFHTEQDVEFSFLCKEFNAVLV